MDAIARQFPMHITIPTPMHTPPQPGVMMRGPFALGALGVVLNSRMSRMDHQLINEAAAALHMKPSAFARWCAVEVARQIVAMTSDIK